MERLNPSNSIENHTHSLERFSKQNYIPETLYGLIGTRNLDQRVEIEGSSIKVVIVRTDKIMSLREKGFEVAYDDDISVTKENSNDFYQPIAYIGFELPHERVVYVNLFEVSGFYRGGIVAPEVYQHFLNLSEKLGVKFIVGEQASPEITRFFIRQGRYYWHELSKEIQDQLLVVTGYPMSTIAILGEVNESYFSDDFDPEASPAERYSVLIEKEKKKAVKKLVEEFLDNLYSSYAKIKIVGESQPGDLNTLIEVVEDILKQSDISYSGGSSLMPTEYLGELLDIFNNQIDIIAAYPSMEKTIRENKKFIS